MLFLLAFSLFSFSGMASQKVTAHKLNWQIKQNQYVAGKMYASYLTFQGASHNEGGVEHLPKFNKKLIFQGKLTNVRLSLRNIRFESIPLSQDFQNKDVVPNDFVITSIEGMEQKNGVAAVSIETIRKSSTGYEKLVSFELVADYDLELARSSFGKTSWAANSVLATGVWIKLAISQTGMHVLDKSYLKSIGLNVDVIDPRTIKIFGMGGGMLPQRNSEFRYDDLPENAIVVEGESDGVFNESDRVLFYAKAQNDIWRYNQSSNRYEHEVNIYSDVTYYFMTYGGGMGKRVNSLPAVTSPNKQTSQFDQRYYYEKESYNLIKSGRQWMGEEFNRITSYSFPINLGAINSAEPVYFLSRVVARSFTPSSFSIFVNGNGVLSQSISAVVADYQTPYAAAATNTTLLNLPTGSFTLNYTYNVPIPGSVGWLDFFELQSRNFLSQTAQIAFRDSRTVGTGNITEFQISSNKPAIVWDVTSSVVPKAINANFSGSIISFSAATDSLREFISFTGEEYYKPVGAERISNQNLHGLAPAQLFIITHPQFNNEAQTLAQFHRTNSGLSVHVISVDQIYNEFASGSQDVSAIRDFLRLFYKRATTPSEMPKYVTLFGRASYDFKNRIANNTNYVPTYESVESFSPIGSYNSDDYLGLLDDNEGKWDSPFDAKEFLDVAIGRLPAQNNVQAQNMLNKVIKYVTQPDLGDWKTKMIFVADDGDFNIHLNGANTLANRAIQEFPNYNVKKVFIDAYPEENTAGGARNPAAQSEIVKSVEQGAMLINYTGHGGEVGWASERILNTDDINGWTNGNKLPLFVTATCEFSRFDDPARTSAGEMVLLNPNGGGIALFTTVRLVFSSANDALNSYLFDHIGFDSAAALNPQRMGEVMRLTKNDYLNNDKNERNFTLLGDPAIYLAYPKYRVQTTTIQQAPVGIVPDTLRAFAKITIGGKITDIQGNTLNNFSGVIYPTVYDKPTRYRTLGNEVGAGSVQFEMQNNVIHRGKASVTNGLFSFTFVVPKDIGYEIGYGKVSYLAENGREDAVGNFQNIIVGGTSDTIPPDAIGPNIRLFLNDENFVYGGITNESPTLIVKLKDENGINITGRGVGRDISLTLNNNVTSTTSLNDFYQSKMDSYQEGEARYKMSDLPQGKNSLKLRAFDVYNNSSEEMLEFIVTNSEEVALKHVLNYPNPFTTNTTFHFDHNKAGEPMTVQIQIYTISGKVVKHLQTDVVTSGNHFEQLSWDGKDEYGDNIGKGVYVYKVKVRSSTGKTAEEYQKLVILN